MEKTLSGAGLHWIAASDHELIRMLMLGLTLLLVVGLLGAMVLRFYLSTRHNSNLRLPMSKMRNGQSG